MINIPLRPSDHQTKLKNKAIVHSNLSMQAVITDINTVYPWHSRKNLLAVNYYYPKYHIMYQVLHFNALQVSIQNTRFQRTYTPIIRTTSYIISTLINTDLIYSCGMLKIKKSSTIKATLWGGGATPVKRNWVTFLEYWEATSDNRQSMRIYIYTDKSSQICVLLCKNSKILHCQIIMCKLSVLFNKNTDQNIT